MTNLFQTIAKVQPTLPGWCSPEKAITLASIIVAYRPEYSMEIGIFGGSSFIPMALAHQAIHHGNVIGIEPWSREIAIASQTEEASRKWWSELDYPALEGNFRATLDHLGLKPWTTIIKSKSTNVEPWHDLGLLHVDGAHDDTAIADVLRFATRVQMGGFVVMDDLQWTGGGVIKAEQSLLERGFKRLYYIGKEKNEAIYQKIA